MQLVDAGMLAFAGWHALKGRVDWPLTFQVPRMLRSTLRDVGQGGAGSGREGGPGSGGEDGGGSGRERVPPGDAYVLCWNARRLRKRELWPEYRDRPEIWDEAGEEDFRLMLRVLSALGAVQYRADGREADEVLAALVHRLAGEIGEGAGGEAGRGRAPDGAGGRGGTPGREELVVRSDDKDFMQLLSHTTRMEGRRRGTVRASDVEEELGVPPAYVADLLALAGDRADGIPRIVPPSTARELIEAHGHVRDWIDRLPATDAGPEEDGGPVGRDGEPTGEEGAPPGEAPMDPELRATLAENREQLLLNLELVDLSEEAVGAPPEPMLDGWGDLEAAREIGERTGIGWLTDDDLAEEWAPLREWGERTRERLGV